MWRLLDFGATDGYTMTNLYEAVGHAVSSGEVPNTVILNHPESPFVNIGYHQLMDKEINVEYAKEQGFILVRRTIGGGAILDGPWEQDYFVIVNRESPECPKSIPEFYKTFMKPPLYALKKLMLNASIRQPNDILVDGKKISGNGAIGIEKANILAGDLLLDAPTHLMSEIINAPSEKFKDKLAESMADWITSIRTETGEEISREYVKQLIIEGFKEELEIELELGEMTENEKKTLERLVEERNTKGWIFSKDNDMLMKVKQESVGTKVRGGLVVSESVHKADKMIRILLVSNEEAIENISISGDFFTQPYTGAIEKLEESLIGVKLEREALIKNVKEAFESIGLMVFGASQDDFVKAILKAKYETR
ncbi:lipoate--protein ligase [Thermoproteota archaeon]